MLQMEAGGQGEEAEGREVTWNKKSIPILVFKSFPTNRTPARGRS
jgi:hypothetical protein